MATAMARDTTTAAMVPVTMTDMLLPTTVGMPRHPTDIVIAESIVQLMPTMVAGRDIMADGIGDGITVTGNIHFSGPDPSRLRVTGLFHAEKKTFTLSASITARNLCIDW